MRAALILPIIPFLSGCFLDDIEGKNPGKDHQQRIAALEAGMARITPITPPQPFTVAAITTPAPEPCYPIFRVRDCP